MKRKLITVLLAVTMICSLFTGCGNSVSKSNENVTGTGGEVTKDSSTASGDVTNLVLCLYSMGTNVLDSDAVEEAINEYVEPLIGAKISIQWISFGDWNNIINLRLSGGQQMDLLPSFGIAINTLYNKEGILPLDDLLTEYGQGIVEQVGQDYIKAGKIGERIYSVPSLQAFAYSKVFMYRQDIADKYNLDFSDVKTLKDLEPLLEVVHKNEADMNCIISKGSDTLLADFGWDKLGDDYGVLMEPDSLVVSNLYETDYYKELIEIMHDWYQKGYIQKDAAISAEPFSNMMTAGKSFGAFMRSAPGVLEEEETSTGLDLNQVQLTDALATTATIKNANWCISSTSENPEKAMQFLNLMYTDPVLANLLAYGIEGEHYQITDKEHGVAGYLDGQDMQTSGYVPMLGYIFGNQFITHLWQGDPLTLYSDLKEHNANTAKSKAAGFTYDSVELTNELTALDNITSKYRAGLESGSVDPAAELPNFIKELKQAGIDTVVKEKQSQLDKWASENGVK